MHIFFIQASIYQWTLGSCFFVHSATLCLLIGAFNPFTFKVIIDRYVVIDILLFIFFLPPPLPPPTPLPSIFLAILAWLMWLSGLSTGLWTKRSLVWFLVRAHNWVAVQVPIWGHATGNQSMFLSLSFSLPYSLKINKYNLQKNISGNTGLVVMNCISFISARVLNAFLNLTC